MANSLGVDLHDKVLEINEAHLLSVIRGPVNLKRRLVRATGGFGCSPHTSGRAVFVTWLIDGDTGRLDGYDFARIVPEDEAAEVLGLDTDVPDFSPPETFTFLVTVEIRAIAGDGIVGQCREYITAMNDAFTQHDIPATVRANTLRSET